MQPYCRLPTDATLGFEAAVAAIGLKANVSEAEHPLLCEGTRRHRGDLAVTLLVHYKDYQDKLEKVFTFLKLHFFTLRGMKLNEYFNF